MKEKCPHVKVAVKTWFGSDLDLIKEHTAKVQDASDSEKSEDEDKEEKEEEEVKADELNPEKSTLNVVE